MLPINAAVRIRCLVLPAGENSAGAAILNLAAGAGIEALATSCPLCEYNLGKQQGQMIEKGKIASKYSNVLLHPTSGCSPGA